VTRERISLAPRPSVRKVAGSRTSRTDWAPFVLLSILLLVFAFLRSWGAVAGLRWPFDSDHLRNIADAVTFKDGDVLSDALTIRECPRGTARLPRDCWRLCP
jgi:hypothetical protein